MKVLLVLTMGFVVGFGFGCNGGEFSAGGFGLTGDNGASESGDPLPVTEEGSELPEENDPIEADTTTESGDALLAPICYWPPNHKYVSISMESLFGNDSGCQFANVVSSEEQEGLSEEDLGEDYLIESDISLSLRIERYSAEGRLYQVSIYCPVADADPQTHILEVSVPHDMGRQAEEMDCLSSLTKETDSDDAIGSEPEEENRQDNERGSKGKTK